MSLKHLHPVATEALQKGRGILFMAEWRPPAMPDHLMSVVGCLDDEKFYMSLLPEGFDGEPRELEIESAEVPDLTGLALESADAMAASRLWNRWHNGLRQEVEELTRLMATLLLEPKVLTFLDELRAPKQEPQKKQKSTPGAAQEEGAGP